MSVRREREPTPAQGTRAALRRAVLRFAMWDAFFVFLLVAALIWLYADTGAVEPATEARREPEDTLLTTLGAVVAYFAVTVFLFVRILAPVLKGFSNAR